MFLSRTNSPISTRVLIVLFAWLLTVVLGSLVGCDRTQHDREPPAESDERGDENVQAQRGAVAKLVAAVERQDWNLARRLCRDALISQPNDPDLITKVAIVYANSDEKREASLMLVRAAEVADYSPPQRVQNAVAALIDAGDLYSAIDLMQRCLDEHPERTALRRNLVGFLAEAQLTQRTLPHLRELIKRRSFDFPLLISTTDTSSRRLSEKTSARLLKRNPDDHRIRLADAFLHLYRRDASSAASVLEEIVARHPEFAPAYAMLGHAMVITGRYQEIPKWLRDAPAEAEQYADYWLALGDKAAEDQKTLVATKAYWKATQCDPNRLLAWEKLRVALTQWTAGDVSEFDSAQRQRYIEIAIEHSKRLMTLSEQFNDFTARRDQSQTAAAEVAETLLGLGRHWEAEAWSAAATTLAQEPYKELNELRARIVGSLRQSDEWFDRRIPSLAMDLSILPDVKLAVMDGALNSPALANGRLIPPKTTTEHLRLSEQSRQWGLNEIGSGNNPTNARLAALIRSTGVGGGTIDFDKDGLPDIFIVNAGGTMLEYDSQPNQLLRNTGESFVRVGASARIDDRGFGQGVAVGDFNEDGWPDIYVGNLGTKKLFRNNGDGTFSDCSRLLENQTAGWYTSGAFIDVNGDAVADLITTRYCKVVEDLDEACPNEEGVLGFCHPLRFAADSDQYHVAKGDGSYSDATSEWIGEIKPGRGLGIVSGNISGQGIGVFIANDMSRNEYYSRSESGDSFLTESASVRGVAVDGQTRAQASMGIASSDLDLDGDLDFYVTGFAREYNVYYEQVSPGLWRDATAKQGLVDPTLGMIGFGSEAIDLENDGVEELIVTNGHIGDFSDPEAPPYELPMQIFRRGGDSRFELVGDDGWGEYFQQHHVGRTLWTCDVNRDGLQDVFVTHMNEQLRLLLNQSQSGNHVVAFSLVATDCSRDAVGATIRFRHGDQERTMWMLSGDGYFCSNEKTLLAGLGEHESIDDVVVTWADGSSSNLGTLKADQRYLIVQGQESAFVLHQYD